LKVRGIRWRSLAAYPQLRDVHERGRTFEANAKLKAKSVARQTGCWALADDSGLEVRALQNAPGVRSARFAGRHGDDEANNRTVLRLLAGVPAAKRTARYRCVLVLASPTQVLAMTEGVFAGRIATAPKGANGFGYDPIFYVPRLRKTVAQIPLRLKNRLSHRARAAHQMRRCLMTLRD